MSQERGTDREEQIERNRSRGMGMVIEGKNIEDGVLQRDGSRSTGMYLRMICFS